MFLDNRYVFVLKQSLGQENERSEFVAYAWTELKAFGPLLVVLVEAQERTSPLPQLNGYNTKPAQSVTLGQDAESNF